MGIFDTDIKKLYGVGAARASHYASLGIHSVGDLLCHYPRGYEDRGNVKLLIDADGETKCAHLLTVDIANALAFLIFRPRLSEFSLVAQHIRPSGHLATSFGTYTF